MIKVYRFTAGKLIPHFEHKQIDSVEEAEKMIGWFFESKRSDHSIQFAIADKDEILKLVKSEK